MALWHLGQLLLKKVLVLPREAEAVLLVRLKVFTVGPVAHNMPPAAQLLANRESPEQEYFEKPLATVPRSIGYRFCGARSIFRVVDRRR